MRISRNHRRPAGHQPGDGLRLTLLAIVGVVLLSDSLALRQGAPAAQPRVAAIGIVSAGQHLAPGSRPTAIQIPKIAVDTRLTSIHIGPTGELQAPTDYYTPGWWSEGSQPGSAGPTIIVGHVDSLKRAAVFFHLRQLRPMDTVLIPRKDGTTAVFSVDALREFSKSDFPTSLVYGHTKGSTLRLITCGGRFDAKSQHYLDNVIVFAHLVKVTPTSKRVAHNPAVHKAATKATKRAAPPKTPVKASTRPSAEPTVRAKEQR